MLNSTKNDLVLQEDFLPMVKRLDECLGYLEEHVSRHTAYIRHSLTTERFQRCRGLSLTISTVHDEEYDLDQDFLCE